MVSEVDFVKKIKERNLKFAVNVPILPILLTYANLIYYVVSIGGLLLFELSLHLKDFVQQQMENSSDKKAASLYLLFIVPVCHHGA